MAQDYTNMSVQDKLRLADERLEKLKGTDKYAAFKKRVDAMHAKYGRVPEGRTWDRQKLLNKVESYDFDAVAYGQVDKNGEPDLTKDKIPMLDPYVTAGFGGEKFGISEHGIMTRPVPDFYTRPKRLPSADELAESYREMTKPLDYLRLKRGGTVDELAASFNAMKRGLRTTQAAKGGDAPDLTGMSNFLATDKVPNTIFGIPVVSKREDYTEADLEFFREHPEAGGYYDMGGGTPEDGTPEGAPVQDDEPKDQLPSATFLTGRRDDFDTVGMVQYALKNNYTAEQFLRLYYGDATDRIVGKAKELRGMPVQNMVETTLDLRDYQPVDRASADPAARDLSRFASGGPSESLIYPDLPIIAVGPGAVRTNEITKEVLTDIAGSVYAELPRFAPDPDPVEHYRALRQYSRAAVVLKTQKQLYWGIEKWLEENKKRSFQSGRYVFLGRKEDGPHEVSHLLNPNKDLRYIVESGPTYLLQNDAELSAAISAARREIFKRSGGKVDIADPRHMRAVLNEVKPGATDEETKARRAPYEGKWLSEEARKFLYNYWTYKGSPRARDVNRKVVDPKFTGQLVKAGERKGRKAVG